MSQERTISSLRAYEGRTVNLRVDTVEVAGGRIAKREVVEHRGAVVIAAIDGQRNLALVRQYRKPVDQELLELPAGTLGPGEDPEACANRELKEETGFSAGKMESLGGFYSSPGFCTEFLYLFLATELTAGDQANDEDEETHLVSIPLRQAPELIARGEIRDSKSVAGILRVLRERFPDL